MSLKFLSSRELSKRPGQALRNLKKDGLRVLTQNGQPKALIFSISAENLDVEIATFRRFQLGQAVERLRAEAATRGLELSDREIDAEITAARAAKR